MSSLNDASDKVYIVYKLDGSLHEVFYREPDANKCLMKLLGGYGKVVPTNLHFSFTGYEQWRFREVREAALKRLSQEEKIALGLV